MILEGTLSGWLKEKHRGNHPIRDFPVKEVPYACSQLRTAPRTSPQRALATVLLLGSRQSLQGAHDVGWICVSLSFGTPLLIELWASHNRETAPFNHLIIE